MRHRFQKNSSFSRHRGPRAALIRGLLRSLIEQERIKTTLPRARAIRPLVEKAITMGKKNNLNARRQLLRLYPWKVTIAKIMKDLAPRFKDRLGGYTRIIKLGFRAGDQAPLAYLEFVDRKLTFTSSTLKKSPSASSADSKEEAKKKTTKKSASSVDKKQKRKQAKQLDKNRKKLRQQQKHSRRKNRV